MEQGPQQTGIVFAGLAVALLVAFVPATCLGLGFIPLVPAVICSAVAVYQGRQAMASSDEQLAAKGRIALIVGGLTGALGALLLLLIVAAVGFFLFGLAGVE